MRILLGISGLESNGLAHTTRCVGVARRDRDNGNFYRDTRGTHRGGRFFTRWRCAVAAIVAVSVLRGNSQKEALRRQRIREIFGVARSVNRNLAKECACCFGNVLLT